MPAACRSPTGNMLKISSLASMAIGVQTLRVNPMRTVLSTLGIIIGVASLVAILALGDGLERYSREQIEFTTDLQTVVVDSRTTERINTVIVRRDDYPEITPEHARSLERELGDIAFVVLAVRGAAPVSLADDTTRLAANVAATTANVPNVLDITPSVGRFFDAHEVSGNLPVTAISDRLATALSGEQPVASLIGRTLLIADTRHEIVGILESGGTADRPVAYVPLTAADSLLTRGRIPRPPTLMVKAHQIEDVQEAERHTRRWLEEEFGSVEANFNIATSTGRLAQAQQGVLVFKLVMGAITGISILVGGIGVMNILLASVTERTHEIGIRKSTGASKNDILLQFLFESVAISGVGSGLGVVLGLTGAFTITFAIRRITEAPVYAAFTWGTVLVAVVAAVVVGVVFGTYPARRAAKLSPIEAIRHE
jgi:putative ABC transport system permease protein